MNYIVRLFMKILADIIRLEKIDISQETSC